MLICYIIASDLLPFRLYENLMMVLTRSAAVSTFNSEYDGPLQRMDNWGNMLWIIDSINSAKDLKKQQTGYDEKSVPTSSIPSASKYEKNISFSYFRLKTFLTSVIPVVAKKSIFDKMKESSSEILRTETTKNVKKRLQQKLRNNMPKGSYLTEKHFSTVLIKSNLADKTYH